MAPAGDVTGLSNHAPRAPGGLRDRKACRAAARVLPLLFVAFLLVGASTAASHSHTGGPTTTATCMICHFADSDWSLATPLVAPAAQSPDFSCEEYPESSGLRDRPAMDRLRARSPPA